MPAVILKAHCDGKHIVPDEPCELPTNAALAVTVLPPVVKGLEGGRAGWAALGCENLVRACGDQEPEYSLADARP